MTKRAEEQAEREEYKIELEKHKIEMEKIKAFDDRLLSNSQIVSRSILYLSAVGIGFMIKPLEILTTNTWAIKPMLILFTLAIITTLISFPISNRALRQGIKKINKGENPYKVDLLSKTINGLSLSSIAIFLIAIIILLLTQLLNTHTAAELTTQTNIERYKP